MIHSHSSLRWLLALLLSAMTLSWTVSGSKPDWDADAARRKADYLFMESKRLELLENTADVTHPYLRRAHHYAPHDKDLSRSLGIDLIFLGLDSLSMAQGIDYLKDYVDSNPRDYHAAAGYITLCENLGRYDEAVRVGAILDSLFSSRTSVTLRYVENLTNLYLRGDSSAAPRALKILERMEDGVGKEAWLVSRKIRIYSAMNDTTALLSEAMNAVAEKPHDSDLALLAASVNALFQRPDSARVYFDRACAIDSTDGKAYLMRAEFIAAQGDTIAYKNEVNRILRMESLDFDTKRELLPPYIGTLIRGANDSISLDRALANIDSTFAVLLDQNMFEPSLHMLYGQYLTTSNRADRATEHFQTAVDLEQSNIDYRLALINNLAALKKYDEMAEACEQARKLSDIAALYFFESTALTDLKRYDRALEVLDEGISRTKEPQIRSMFLSSKGDIYHLIGLTDSMYNAYDEAIRLDSHNYMAFNNAAYFMTLDGIDLDKAERYAALAVRGEPDNPTYLDTYAWVFFKKQEYVLAKQYIDAAIAKSDDDDLSAEVFEHAGDIYFMSGLPDDALKFWQQALELDPHNELLQRKVKARTFFYN